LYRQQVQPQDDNDEDGDPHGYIHRAGQEQSDFHAFARDLFTHSPVPIVDHNTGGRDFVRHEDAEGIEV
jgi:hypothetical protein